LRDHIEAIDILKLLRADIVAYFHSKLPKPVPAVVEKPAVKPVVHPDVIIKPAVKPVEVPKPIVPAPAPKPVIIPPKPLVQPTFQSLQNKDNADAEAPKEKGSLVNADSSKKDVVELIQTKKTELHLAHNLIQKIEKLGQYEHLLGDTQKLVLAELKRFSGDVSAVTKNVDEFTKTQGRSDKEIGSGHVDNTKGELKRLETPDFEGSAQFNIEAEKKILRMIDGLIHHLQESKDKLTKDEIHAAEDFAVFQNNLLKEQRHLKKTIEALEVKIKEFLAQISVAEAQLVKRKKLRDQAKLKLIALKKLCAEKYRYFLAETRRRNHENVIIDKALDIFAKLVKRSSGYRASRRSSANYEGVKYGKADNVDARVVRAEKGVTSDYNARLKGRNEIAY